MRFLSHVSLAGVAVTACVAACVGGDPDATPAPSTDAGVDTGTDGDVADTSVVDPDAGAGCDPLAPFTKFEPVAGDVNTMAVTEAGMTLTDDETEMLFYAHGTRNDGGVFGDPLDHELWVARRNTPGDPWTASIVGELASAMIDGGANGTGKTGIDSDPAITRDGRMLVWSTQRAGIGPYELFMSTRASRSVAWGSPVIVESVKSAGFEGNPHFNADGSRLYFVSDKTGTALVYEAEVSGGKIGAPSPLVGPINDEPTGNPVLSADGLVMYVRRTVNGDTVAGRILRATRASTTQAFGAPVPVPELSLAHGQTANWISRDDCRLYFTLRETADTATDLWLASR